MTSKWLVSALALSACHPGVEVEAPDSPVVEIDSGVRYEWCGDGLLNGEEACDDTNGWGGDGCSSTCTLEAGLPEREPNDSTAQATEVPEGTAELDGSFPADDVDCWAFEAAACEAITIRQVEPCTSALALSLHASDGSTVANGGIDETGCATVDPAEEPGARWIVGGAYTACASAIAGAIVADYALNLTTAASDTSWPVSGGDIDADGRPASCDVDRDGDGVLDADDTCPDLSNGDGSGPLVVDSAGYVTDWLTAGPFTSGTSTDSCLPTDTAYVGESPSLAPAVNDAAGTTTWVARLATGASLDFNARYATIEAPREAYAFVYLNSPTARTLTLSMGADDGMYAWWNGVKVLSVNSCQGVYGDQFQATVDVLAGVNTLLVKVYDQGGGWGMAARLLDSGAAVMDLTPSLSADGTWRADQTDSDGDGVGDVCE